MAARRRRYRIYLDSSIWSSLAERSDLEQRRSAYRFLSRTCRRETILTSALVDLEVRSRPDSKERSTVERLLRAWAGERLGRLPEAADIARELLSSGGFAESMLADLTHVGYAVLGGADAIATWDRRTFARDAVRTRVHAFCRREGRAAPLIGTPEEIAQWLGLRRPR